MGLRKATATKYAYFRINAHTQFSSLFAHPQTRATVFWPAASSWRRRRRRRQERQEIPFSFRARSLFPGLDQETGIFLRLQTGEADDDDDDQIQFSDQLCSAAADGIGPAL
jgi:hypothetical protein